MLRPMTEGHRADDPGMRIVTAAIPLSELAEMAAHRFGGLVKVVVDIERGIMAVDGEMHADEETLLLDHGSRQQDLWGVNLYPDEHGTPGFIEFDSMINIRPRQDNRSRSVEDPAARQQIILVVARLVEQ